MSNQEITKFEFLLTLGGNIICQRYFNVKDHNPKARRSMDIHEYVKNIWSIIHWKNIQERFEEAKKKILTPLPVK